MDKYKLTESQKTKKRAIAFVEEIAPYTHGMSNSSEEYRRDLANYRLYNNIIDQKEFEDFCNPLKLDIPFKRDVIKPYNKAYTYIDVLRGEELKRSDKPSATLIGRNAIEKKNQELKETYMKVIRSRIQAEIRKQVLLQQGKDPSELEEEVGQYMSPEDIDTGEFKSELEILANHIINYAQYKHDMLNSKNEGFFHALITGKECIYVGRNNPNGEPEIRVLNPLFLFYDKSPNTKYIQDGSWAEYRTIRTPYEVLEMYGDELTDKDKASIMDDASYDMALGGMQIRNPMYHVGKSWDTRHAEQLNEHLTNPDYLEDEHGLYGTSYYNGKSIYKDRVTVSHIEWKWLRKVGFLTYINKYGDEETTVVSEEYKVPKDAIKVRYRNKFNKMVDRYEWGEGSEFSMIEYMWVPDVWEATRIGHNIYVRVRRKPGQTISPDTPFNNKLSYKGLKYSAANTEVISVQGRMKPFLYLYIGVLYKLGDLIARTVGPVQDIDASMIDPELGLEKTLFYQRKGLNLYNSITTPEGARYNMSRPQPGRVNQISAYADINQFINLAQWLEMEIGKAAGISPQRAAQFSSDTNVSDNQQAITQSSHMTEVLFTEHNTLWRHILNDYIGEFIDYMRDYFNSTSNDDFFLSYILPGKGTVAVSILPEHLNLLTEVGIFVTNATDNYRYIEDMVNLSLTAMQNGQATFEDISNIIKAKTQGTSVEEVHKMIQLSRKRQEEREAQQQQAQQKAMELQQKMQRDAMLYQEELARQTDLLKIQAETEGKKQVEQIKQSSKQSS